MDHLTIPIPAGLDERQKADLIGWLSEQARQAVGTRLAIENDPSFRQEAVSRIKCGMKDVEAGRTLTPQAAKRRIADRFGLADPE